MGTNPLVSLPDTGRYRKALAQCPTVVVSDCVSSTDTGELADILLPACGWSEKNGTVTNSERRISRQRPLFKPSGQSRPDWWIISQVAVRLGYQEAFAYDHPSEIFREHAALSCFENEDLPELGFKRRDFNIGALSVLTVDEYDQMEPAQWPCVENKTLGMQRLFAKGDFFTADRKGRFIPLKETVHPNQPSTKYPLLLNTGRIRDQWHTMTRTGLSATLSQHIDEPFLEIHPDDAGNAGIKAGMLCQISAPGGGTAIVRVKVTDTGTAGVVFMPMHWTRQNSRSGQVGKVVHRLVDPISGQPDLKHTPVNIQVYNFAYEGVLITRERQSLKSLDYATEVRGEQCFRYEFAGQQLPVLPCEKQSEAYECVTYRDSSTGDNRVAWFRDNVLEGVFIAGYCLSPSIDRQWLQQLFLSKEIGLASRWQILAGRPVNGEGKGPVVCACFGVGEKAICQALAEHQADTPAKIGELLKAGTNCGSCIPELSKLIETQMPIAKEKRFSRQKQDD